MNIGVLGGTFDPIHKGHLVVAEEVENQLNLAVVLFLPAGQPWLKTGSIVSAAEHRVQMVRLALADEPSFELSTVEVEHPGPSYTVDTVSKLRTQLDDGDELFFILGWDSLAQLTEWHEPLRLITMCRLVAVPRVGYPVPQLKKLDAHIPGVSQRVMVMDRPRIDVSASAIRERVARGLSIYHLVPEPVNRYIKQHGLYI